MLRQPLTTLAKRSTMTHSDSRRRYAEIGKVLAHHGFEFLWSKWGIEKVLGRIEKAIGEKPKPAETQPERLRITLEELGTTFIKLGQMLSTRPDMLPPEYIAELSKLQDNAPRVPYELIVEAIQSQFGASPQSVFQVFEVEARAAGSIAQVHNAVLPDGTPVVVKIRRPGIELQVEEDLAILGRIGRFISNDTDFGKHVDLDGLVDEFAFTLRNELDFIREGQNAERIAGAFAGDPSLRVPKIYWEFSTTSILTMEDIRGIKIDDLEALDSAGINRKNLAKNCAHIALVQVLDQGFFHADPHPGNFFVQPDGTIALLDYGMVGRLGEHLRNSLLRLSMAISRRDADCLIDELLAMGAAKGGVDRQRLSRDLDRLLSQYEGASLGSFSAGQVLREITGVAQRNGLTFPSELMVVVRVLTMDEGLGANLDPDFNFIEFGKPYFERFWLKSHSLKATAKRMKEGAIDLADLSVDLPERLVRLLGIVERGELKVTTQVEMNEALSNKLQQAANRIAVSVLTAGLVIGLSVIALVYRPTNSEGPTYFILKGLLAVVVASTVWLLIAIWRSTR